MEGSLTVDGIKMSVNAGAHGGVVIGITDAGNCDVIDIALTETQASILGLLLISAAEEDATK